MAVDSGEYTPETIASRQKIADQLLLQAMKPREIRSPLQGLGQLGEAGLAGWLGYKDEQEQKQGAAAQAAAIAGLLNGGQAPATSPMPSAAPAVGPGAPPSAVQEVNAGDFNSIDAMASPAGKFDPNYQPMLGAANRAVAKVESGGSGGYSALGPETGGDRAYGKHQVMGKNVGSWTEDVLGKRMDPQAFLANPDAQDAVFNAKFGGDVQKYGNLTDPASKWFSGKPLAEAGNRADVTGTTVPQYVQRVAAALGPGAGAPADGGAPPQATQVAQNATVGSSSLPVPVDNKAAVAKLLTDPNPYVRKLGISLGQGLIQKQLEGDKPTDEMREYSLYRQQGGKDSFFDYKSGLKKAGAQNIAVNNTINPIVKGVGERFNDSMDAAKASIPQIQGIHEARKALDEGAITGLGADPKLFLAKAANLFGLDEKAAANTEVARSAIGNSVLAKAKTLGANPSNTDRDYIEKVVGGQIQLEEPSIRRLLDMQEKWARDSIRRANAEGEKLLKAQPKELENIAPLLSITEPPSYEDFLKANPKAAAAAPSVPAGAVRWERGPDGKPRRVQ